MTQHNLSDYINPLPDIIAKLESIEHDTNNNDSGYGLVGRFIIYSLEDGVIKESKTGLKMGARLSAGDYDFASFYIVGICKTKILFDNGAVFEVGDTLSTKSLKDKNKC